MLIAAGGSLGCAARIGISTVVCNAAGGLVTLEKMRVIKYRHSQQ
jgi:gamma-glutamyl phosphate reductase